MSKKFPKIYLYFSLALLLGPFVFLILHAFLNSNVEDQESWNFILKETLPDLISNTGLLILYTLKFSLIFGIAQSILVELTEIPGKKILHSLFIIPLVFPLYIISYIYVGAFEYSGAIPTLMREAFNWDMTKLINIKSPLSISLIFSFVLTPYVYLFMRSFLMRVDHKLIWSARSMGRSSKDVLKSLIIPQSKPWIFSSAIFVILEVLCDFGGVSVFNFETFSTAIYESWVSLYSFKTAIKISVLPLLFATILFLFNFQMKKKMINKESYGPIILFSPSKTHTIFIYSLVFLYALFSLFFPIVQLMIWSSSQISVEGFLDTLSYLKITIFIGVLAAFVIGFITLITNYFSRFDFNKKDQYLSNFLKLGYALPGTIVGIGIMGVCSLFGINFFGPIAIMALVIGLLMRFYSVSYDMQYKSFELIPKKIDWVSRSLGIKKKDGFLKVHLPILKPAIISAMLLCFLEVIKEMPVTLILRPHGFDTLATKIYELTSEGEWERSSLYALVLLFFGMIPVILNAINMKSKENVF